MRVLASAIPCLAEFRYEKRFWTWQCPTLVRPHQTGATIAGHFRYLGQEQFVAGDLRQAGPCCRSWPPWAG